MVIERLKCGESKLNWVTHVRHTLDIKDLISKIRLKYLTYLKATDSFKLISNMMAFVFLEYHPDCSYGEWNKEKSNWRYYSEGC